MGTIRTYLLLALTTLSSLATLTVFVKDIQAGKGDIVVEIYDNKNNFSGKKRLITKSLKAEKETLDFTFELAEGTYAIKAFQDINQNKRCDEGWFHIPKEPYGLSNNFLPKHRAPKFEDCKFNVSGQTTQQIQLH